MPLRSVEPSESRWLRSAGALAVLALALVLPRPAFAYRTAADLPEFAGTPRVRWADSTLHYNIASWLPAGLDRSAVEQAVAQAFAVWSAPECTSIRFSPGGFVDGAAVAGDGVVTIQFLGQSWEERGFDPTAAATTDVTYDSDTRGRWRIADAAILLNATTFSWTTQTSDPIARDLVSVLAHEIGHALGLEHPCSLEESREAPSCGPQHQGLLMHPEYSGQRGLSSDEIAGLCFLYEPSACDADGCPEGMACTFEGCAPVCDGAICLPGDRCGPRGCTAAPCAPGSCERGCEETCHSPGGAAADPCTTSLECYSGHCSALGYCTTSCAGAGASCAEGYSCETSIDPPECRLTGKAFGQDCMWASECHSALCLRVDHAETLCTRACGTSALMCPAGFACGQVEAQEVCIPEASGDSRGCTMGGPARNTGSAWWALAALLGIAIRMRSKRLGGLDEKA